MGVSLLVYSTNQLTQLTVGLVETIPVMRLSLGNVQPMDEDRS
jgi:hypothetical protein